MWLASGCQMQEIDAVAIERYGVPGQLLMEAAAAFIARTAANMLPLQGQVIVVTGRGNNGGDGWGAARHLAAWGHQVKVLTAVDPADLRGDAALQFAIYKQYGLPWERYQPEKLAKCDLVVDALLGTGISGAPRGAMARIIADINRLQKPVLAVDIPSGLPADASPPLGEVVDAAATACLGLAKQGLFTPAGRKFAGKVTVDPIGLPAQLLQTDTVLNTPHWARDGLPRRCPDSHKGSYGRGLLVAGSRGMSGAALLAARAALRSGLGLLTVACPQSINTVIEGGVWEALTWPLPETEQGCLGSAAAATMAGHVDRYSAVAVGPGLGKAGQELVEMLMATDLPLVVDADGLNLLAPGFPRRQAATVITPHPGEMARLLGNTIEEVLARPLAVARQTAADWQCVVVLKGPTSYIAAPDGRVAVNITGSDGLATGGAGDVLAGLILGLLAQNSAPFAAACAAAWLLGRASELAVPELGTAAQLPGDILNFLPRAIKELSGQGKEG